MMIYQGLTGPTIDIKGNESEAKAIQKAVEVNVLEMEIW